VDEFNTIKKAVEKIWAVQDKYAKFGACDTEPRIILRSLLRKAVKGETVTVPTTGAAWELYADSMSCNQAAKSLHSATTKLIKLIQKHENYNLEDYLLSLLD
jgi:hypothetical protein